LKQLDSAKSQWALEHSKDETAIPLPDDLMPYLKAWPTCPAGGTFTLGRVGDVVSCSVPGHTY
jgi:hypothetical protein